VSRTTMVVSATLFLMFVTQAGGAANLLVNGDFSNGLSGWVSVGQTGCVQGGWADGIAWVESQCGAAVSASWTQTVLVDGGAAYRITFRARSIALDGGADVGLSFTGEGGEVVWGVPVHSFTDDTPWTDSEWAFLAPDDAVSLEVSPGIDRALSGRIEFDEISLEKIEDGGPRRLSVNCTSRVGRIRDLQQTNRGPLLANHDYGEQFASTGIGMVRSHDYNGPFDMSRIFPNPDADVDDPVSYHFQATDILALDIYDHGLELFFRLGESWNGIPSSRMSPEKWARLACNVVRHFNEGWANGHHLGIRYWEIWNEPNGSHFWNDSDEAFADLYAAAAIAIKTLDPDLMVGGPGMAGYTARHWVRNFLEMIRERSAPLDFYSWHIYHMGNPHTVAAAQRSVRQIVDEAGYTEAEVINTEWNLNPGSGCAEVNCGPRVLSAYSAAHLVSAINYWQDTDIALAFRYRTDAYPIFGLFGDGEEYPLYSPSGWAYLLLDAFHTSSVRLQVEGGDEAGYTIMAGRGEAPPDPITIIISDPGSAASGYELQLENPPSHFRWRVEEISNAKLCDFGDCEIPVIASGDSTDIEGNTLRINMQPPAVHRITLTPTMVTRDCPEFDS